MNTLEIKMSYDRILLIKRCPESSSLMVRIIMEMHPECWAIIIREDDNILFVTLSQKIIHTALVKGIYRRIERLMTRE